MSYILGTLYSEINQFNITIEETVFVLFCCLGLFSANNVANTKNHVFAVFFLILVFFSTVGLIMFIEVQFLSMIFLIVYVGAIAVLFLFVVMMFDFMPLKAGQYRRERVNDLPLGRNDAFIVICTGLMYFSLLKSIENVYLGTRYSTDSSHWFSHIIDISDTQSLGDVLYINNYIPFLMSGMILLVSMIGAIGLTLEQYKKSKKQNIFRQVSRDVHTSIILKKENRVSR